MSSSDAPTIPRELRENDSRSRAKRKPARQGKEGPSRLIGETRSTPPIPRVSRNSGRESQQARHKSNVIHIIQTNLTAAGRQKNEPPEGLAAGGARRRKNQNIRPFSSSFFP
jgi:hypothetical protein